MTLAKEELEKLGITYNHDKEASLGKGFGRL